MFSFFLKLALAITVFVSATPVFAHSGGLNSQGCHAGSRPYHCHRAQTNVSRSNNSVAGDKDCADFASWLEAQIFFEQSGSHDPHRLDADNDGIACEHLQ